jgi:hypothetical protein
MVCQTPVAHACNPSTWEPETERLMGEPGLQQQAFENSPDPTTVGQACHGNLNCSEAFLSEACVLTGWGHGNHGLTSNRLCHHGKDRWHRWMACCTLSSSTETQRLGADCLSQRSDEFEFFILWKQRWTDQRWAEKS